MGRSAHEDGRAGDIRGSNAAVDAYLHKNAGQYGLGFPVKGDPVHVIVVDDKTPLYRQNTSTTPLRAPAGWTLQPPVGGNPFESANALKN